MLSTSQGFKINIENVLKDVKKNFIVNIQHGQGRILGAAKSIAMEKFYVEETKQSENFSGRTEHDYLS